MNNDDTTLNQIKFSISNYDVKKIEEVTEYYTEFGFNRTILLLIFKIWNTHTLNLARNVVKIIEKDIDRNNFPPPPTGGDAASLEERRNLYELLMIKIKILAFFNFVRARRMCMRIIYDRFSLSLPNVTIPDVLAHEQSKFTFSEAVIHVSVCFHNILILPAPKPTPQQENEDLNQRELELSLSEALTWRLHCLAKNLQKVDEDDVTALLRQPNHIISVLNILPTSLEKFTKQDKLHIKLIIESIQYSERTKNAAETIFNSYIPT